MTVNTTALVAAAVAAVSGAAVARTYDKYTSGGVAMQRSVNKGAPKLALSQAAAAAESDAPAAVAVGDSRVMFSLFCRDIKACSVFFQQLFGWPEEIDFRSPIYRALNAPNCVLGFHADPATQLLGLSRDRRADPSSDPVASYPTLQVC